MTYHEAFWVVAGTAAPVIALAAIVTMGQTTGIPSGALEIGDSKGNEAFALGAFAASACCLVMQLAALALALTSLAHERDQSGPLVPTLLIGAGLLVLVLVFLLMTFATGLERRSGSRMAASGSAEPEVVPEALESLNNQPDPRPEQSDEIDSD